MKKHGHSHIHTVGRTANICSSKYISDVSCLFSYQNITCVYSSTHKFHFQGSYSYLFLQDNSTVVQICMYMKFIVALLIKVKYWNLPIQVKEYQAGEAYLYILSQRDLKGELLGKGKSKSENSKYIMIPKFRF